VLLLSYVVHTRLSVEYKRILVHQVFWSEGMLLAFYLVADMNFVVEDMNFVVQDIDSHRLMEVDPCLVEEVEEQKIQASLVHAAMFCMLNTKEAPHSIDRPIAIWSYNNNYLDGSLLSVDNVLIYGNYWVRSHQNPH